MITVYLMIGGFLALGFIAALMARVLIPISLWFWGRSQRRNSGNSPTQYSKLSFNSPGGGPSPFYNVIGSANFCFPSCRPAPFQMNRFAAAGLPNLAGSAYCSIRSISTLATGANGLLGFFGILGLFDLYGMSGPGFVFVRLGEAGRARG